MSLDAMLTEQVDDLVSMCCALLPDSAEATQLQRFSSALVQRVHALAAAMHAWTANALVHLATAEATATKADEGSDIATPTNARGM